MSNSISNETLFYGDKLANTSIRIISYDVGPDLILSTAILIYHLRLRIPAENTTYRRILTTISHKIITANSKYLQLAAIAAGRMLEMWSCIPTMHLLHF